MIKNGSFKCHLVPGSDAAKNPLQQSHSGWCDMVAGNVKLVVSPSGRGGRGLKSRQPDHIKAIGMRRVHGSEIFLESSKSAANRARKPRGSS